MVDRSQLIGIAAFTLLLAACGTPAPQPTPEKTPDIAANEVHALSNAGTETHAPPVQVLAQPPAVPIEELEDKIKLQISIKRYEEAGRLLNGREQALAARGVAVDPLTRQIAGGINGSFARAIADANKSLIHLEAGQLTQMQLDKGEAALGLAKGIRKEYGDAPVVGDPKYRMPQANELSSRIDKVAKNLEVNAARLASPAYKIRALIEKKHYAEADAFYGEHRDELDHDARVAASLKTLALRLSISFVPKITQGTSKLQPFEHSRNLSPDQIAAAQKALLEVSDVLHDYSKWQVLQDEARQLNGIKHLRLMAEKVGENVDKSLVAASAPEAKLAQMLKDRRLEDATQYYAANRAYFTDKGSVVKPVLSNLATAYNRSFETRLLSERARLRTADRADANLISVTAAYDDATALLQQYDEFSLVADAIYRSQAARNLDTAMKQLEPHLVALRHEATISTPGSGATPGPVSVAQDATNLKPQPSVVATGGPVDSTRSRKARFVDSD